MPCRWFMMKRIHLSAWMMMGYALCAGAVLSAWGAGDYFPAKVGNYWLFSYRSSSGGWGSNAVDSGTVTWEIRSIIATKSYPAQVTAMIEQTRALAHRKFTPGIMVPPGLPGYDSVYSPPRITRDSLRLRWLEPGNAITRDTDTCFIMAHDPAGTLPAGKAVIGDTSVIYGGNPVSATIIDPSPCRSGMQQCEEPDWFVTAAGIGPVGYFKRSPLCLMDAYWSETWDLVRTNTQSNGILPHRHLNLTYKEDSYAKGSADMRIFSPAGRRMVRPSSARPADDLPSGVYLMEFTVGEIRPIVR